MLTNTGNPIFIQEVKKASNFGMDFLPGHLQTTNSGLHMIILTFTQHGTSTISNFTIQEEYQQWKRYTNSITEQRK
jgi:hypothetical protein